MKSFLREIERKLKNRKGNSLDLDSLQEIPLNNLECYYLFDFTKNSVVYHRGFDTAFGYNEKQFDMDFIFDKYHEEDAPLIKNIVKELVIQLVDITIPEFSNILDISYRFKRSDGTYARVLSNTIVYQTDESDRILSVLIKYTDISFTRESEAVEWKVDSTYFDADKMQYGVYGDGMIIFTPRELEVISRVFKGESNHEIAVKLNISRHTVGTHRKNILFKSNCSDSNQLHLFCKINGIRINT